MMVKNLMSFPFKTPPVLVCLAIASCCSNITTKNLYDEGVARFPQGAAPTSERKHQSRKSPRSRAKRRIRKIIRAIQRHIERIRLAGD